jgi:hypothetical protein
MRAVRLAAALCIAIGCLSAASGPAAARSPQTWGGESTDDDPAVRARAAYVRGTQFVEKAQWVAALASFEEAASIRSHSLTTYNIGACEQALGHYTRARARLLAALAQNDAAGGSELPAAYADAARRFLDEIERLLVTLHVRVSPADAAISVDGHPLTESKEGAGAAAAAQGGAVTYYSGLRDEGGGEAVPATSFTLRVDPGARLFAVSRRGFKDYVVTSTLAPGATEDLVIALDTLPATLDVSADVDGAVVTVDDVDVGIAPVRVPRPAGSHVVVVRKPGRLTYRTTVAARAGEETNLRVTLPIEKTALTSRWWFWSAVGVVVAGAAATTYFATRPGPQRPAPSGGGLGVVITAP